MRPNPSLVEGYRKFVAAQMEAIVGRHAPVVVGVEFAKAAESVSSARKSTASRRSLSSRRVQHTSAATRNGRDSQKAI